MKVVDELKKLKKLKIYIYIYIYEKAMQVNRTTALLEMYEIDWE